MRPVSFCLLPILGLALVLPSHSQEPALEALTALPAEELQRLAKVAGCEGALVPERWHFLVHAPQAENGYREYVVADHRVEVRREHSQFAEFFRPDAVLEVDTIKVDSDRVTHLVQQYAKANRMTVASANYELSREGPGLAPRWKVDCFDGSGKTIGTLVINATDEKVVSHDGFKKQPGESGSRNTRTSPSSRRSATSALAGRAPAAVDVAESETPAEANPEPVASGPEQRTRPARVRRAQPVRSHPEGPVTRVLRGIFRGDDD